jgi:CspA family cold shock protein
MTSKRALLALSASDVASSDPKTIDRAADRPISHRTKINRRRPCKNPAKGAFWDVGSTVYDLASASLRAMRAGFYFSRIEKLDRAYLRVSAHLLVFGKGIPMSSGTVKWFNAQKGFGFIAPDDGGADAFVHVSAMERAGISDLREGQKLTYELVADRKSGKMTADRLQVQA